jgi:hypothetical protein
VSVEAAATNVLQEVVSDDVRATVLGINDSVIVAAALVGSLMAPVSVEVVGDGAALGATAVGLALAAWWARTAATSPRAAATTRLPSSVRRQEIDEHAAQDETPRRPPPASSRPHVPAQRTPADRLLDVRQRADAAARKW